MILHNTLISICYANDYLKLCIFHNINYIILIRYNLNIFNMCSVNDGGAEVFEDLEFNKP